jgi:hypothetical protein
VDFGGGATRSLKYICRYAWLGMNLIGTHLPYSNVPPRTMNDDSLMTYYIFCIGNGRSLNNTYS